MLVYNEKPTIRRSNLFKTRNSQSKDMKKISGKKVAHSIQKHNWKRLNMNHESNITILPDKGTC